MRTPIDINDALLRELRSLALQQGRPFRAVLEEMLQRGLAGTAPRKRRAPVRIKPLPLGMRPAVQGMSLNQVYDQLEAEADRGGQ